MKFLSNRGTRMVIVGILIVMGVGMVIGTSEVLAEQYYIPSWVNTTAKWWGEGLIGDGDFIKAMQYLIDHKILVVSSGSGEPSLPQVIQNVQSNTGTGQIVQNITMPYQTQNAGKLVSDLLPDRIDI